jgi:formiminoglutamase
LHRFCILGAVHTADLMEACASLDPTKHVDRIALSQAVAILDNRVTKVIDKVLAANKIPIIIGGGHNNCYPILRSFGKQAPIDCINIDAHTDLRVAAGRHSGNGFTHAIEQGYLHNYYMLGIQEPYLSAAMLNTIQTHQNLNYNPYTPGDFNAESMVQQAFKFVNQTNFGLEIDMDVVANFPSSAQSPAGYRFEQLRVLVQSICRQATNTPRYIHICEAAPRYGTTHETGKALALLVNDFT